ncbi:MAG: hypothetical protein AAF182_02590 [Pseudomonadota bacterium]
MKKVTLQFSDAGFERAQKEFDEVRSYLQVFQKTLPDYYDAEFRPAFNADVNLAVDFAKFFNAKSGNLDAKVPSLSVDKFTYLISINHESYKESHEYTQHMSNMEVEFEVSNVLSLMRDGLYDVLGVKDSLSMYGTNDRTEFRFEGDDINLFEDKEYFKSFLDAYVSSVESFQRQMSVAVKDLQCEPPKQRFRLFGSKRPTINSARKAIYDQVLGSFKLKCLKPLEVKDQQNNLS